MLIGGTKLGDWWYRESLLLSLQPFAVAIVYTNDPKRRREVIFANLCTLLRPHVYPGEKKSTLRKSALWLRRQPLSVMRKYILYACW